MLFGVQDERQDSRFVVLAEAVASAHSRLFPEEQQDPRTLQAIALALSELIPIYWQGSQQVVSRSRLEAALENFLVASLEEARASLILRQSPRGLSAAR